MSVAILYLIVHGSDSLSLSCSYKLPFETNSITIAIDPFSKIPPYTCISFGDLRLDLKSEIIFDDGITLTSRGSIGLLNNFDDLRLASDSVLPHVRTDIVKYLKESDEFYIQNLQLNKQFIPLFLVLDQ